jgi:regulator of sigma E protease
VRFSFGFGPRLLGVRWGDTDYRLSLLPLGGYVKMAGDNPAETLSVEDEGRGFLQAAPWKRALIAVAGPAMNLLVPVVVFFAIAVFTVHEGIAPIVGAVMPGSPAERAGMMAGDRVTAVEGKPAQVFEDLRDLIGGHAGQTIVVEVDRAGRKLALHITPESMEEKDDLETTHRGVIGIRPALPPAVIGIRDPGSPAAKAGLRTFDRVVSVDGQPTPDFVALTSSLLGAIERADGKPVEVVAIRARPLGYPGLGPGLPEVVRASLSAAKGADPGILSGDTFVRWVIPGSPAARAGIAVGDQVVELDGKPVQSWWGFEESLRKAGVDKVRLGVVTPGQPMRTQELSAETIALGESEVTGEPVLAQTIGLLHDGEPLLPTERAQPRDWVFPRPTMVPEHYTVGEALVKSTNATLEVTRKEILGILRVFQGRVSVKKLGGPLMIADVARQAALGWAGLVPLHDDLGLGQPGACQPASLAGSRRRAHRHRARRRGAPQAALPPCRRADQRLRVGPAACPHGLRLDQRHRSTAGTARAMSRPMTALLLLSVWGAACRKPQVNPDEAAYGKAVARFAQVSAQTQDLTYRAPGFDEVLAELDSVPRTSEAGTRAAALAQSIRQARLAGAQQDEKSTQLLKQATAAPSFTPEQRLPDEAPAQASPAGGQPPPSMGGSPLTASSVPQGATALPAWYGQRGYLGAQPTPPAAAPPTGEDSPPGSPDAVAGTPDASSAPGKSQQTSTDAGPWRVFGVPGPAGRALGPP